MCICPVEREKREDKERDLSDQIPGVFSPYSPITKKGGGVEGEKEMNTNIKPCRKNLSQKIHLLSNQMQFSHSLKYLHRMKLDWFQVYDFLYICHISSKQNCSQFLPPLVPSNHVPPVPGLAENWTLCSACLDFGVLMAGSNGHQGSRNKELSL